MLITTVVIILGVVLLFLFIKNIIDARKLNSRINPAIFPAFERIEKRCMSYMLLPYVNQEELSKCKAVLSNLNYCDSWAQRDETPSGCWASGYYKFIQSQGFNLPELYIVKEEVK